MQKLMCWENQELQVLFNGAWISWKQLPEFLKRRDVSMKLEHGRISSGYATMQNLLKLDYQLVSVEAKR